MKKYLFLLLFVLATNGISIFAQTGDPNLSPDKLWQEISDSALQQKSLRAFGRSAKLPNFCLE